MLRYSLAIWLETVRDTHMACRQRTNTDRGQIKKEYSEVFPTYLHINVVSTSIKSV
jgi:hypothetical protein